MTARYILSEYVDQAMAQAVYDKLEDGTFSGGIAPCKGVVGSTLEDWILLGIKLAHTLPVIGGVDLNKEPTREPVDTV